MANFEATVRIFEVIEANAPAARRVIDERLRAAGFKRWQVARIGPQGTLQIGGEARRAVRPDVTYAGGGMLVAAVVAWTLWFLWLLAS
jgi:hypothetical protein